jgi:hypothetical protein
MTLTTSEWINLYQSTSNSDRIKAGKVVVGMSPEQIADIKKELEHRKIPIKGKLAAMIKFPEQAKATSNNTSKVFWGEDEWDFLVSKVSALALKEPTTGLACLAGRIMEQMPVHQRRPTHAGLVSDLNKRLIEYNREHWLEVEQELRTAKDELTRRKEALSREEVIASLTDEEIGQFTQRIIDNLSPDDLCSQFSEQTVLDCISQEAVVAHAIAKSFARFGEHTRILEENLTMLSRLLSELPQEKIRRQLQEKAAAPARLPQVAFVGFKAEQIAIVADSLRGRIRIDVIDKNRSRFDSSAEIIIIWTKFISHSFEAQVIQNMKKGARLIRFSGGLEAASREIDRAIRMV